jgi:hypothetical protein
MLASQLIEKLEKLKKERGDLPVYYKSEYDNLNPLTSPWVEIVDEDQAERADGLDIGEPIICIC